jgi:hypothetical protein
MVKVRGIVLVQEGSATRRPALRPTLQDMCVTVVPELAHRQPKAGTERAQALAIAQPPVNHGLLA